MAEQYRRAVPAVTTISRGPIPEIHQSAQMANLKANDKEVLCKWIGGKRDFTLLYQATRDGGSAQAFHASCDDKGPTVTILKNTAGYVFGGYTSQSWSTDYIPPEKGTVLGLKSDHFEDAYYSGICHATPRTYDKNAFLFRLVAPNSLIPKMYRVKQGHESSAIVQDYQSGPCFGNDLQCLRETRYKRTKYFQGNVAVGSQYDMKGDDATTFCGDNVNCTEIEVYQVTEIKGAGAARGEGPWRKVSQSNHKTLISHIERYSLADGIKVKAINLLLLGPVGAGKSSFFNSVNSIFQREITTLARSGSADRSLTTTYRRYRLRSSETGETLKLRLCDTRGLESDGGLDLVDLIAVVEGHVPDRFQFNTTVPISRESTGYNSTPSADDQIHCVAFVIDGTAVNVFPEKILQVIKSLQQRLNPKGIPQVVIVTKADKVCADVQEDVGQMFQSATIADLVYQAGQLLGLQRSCVFPVKNYEEEMEVNEEVDVPILLCLKHVLRYAEDYILDSMASD